MDQISSKILVNEIRGAFSDCTAFSITSDRSVPELLIEILLMN